MLINYAWPQLQRKRLYFQHDRAALHYAVNSTGMAFLDRWIGRLGLFDWPTPSPDAIFFFGDI